MFASRLLSVPFFHKICQFCCMQYKNISLLSPLAFIENNLHVMDLYFSLLDDMYTLLLTQAADRTAEIEKNNEGKDNSWGGWLTGWTSWYGYEAENKFHNSEDITSESKVMFKEPVSAGKTGLTCTSVHQLFHIVVILF